MRKSTTKRTYTCVWCDGRTSNSNKVCNRCKREDNGIPTNWEQVRREYFAAEAAYLQAVSRRDDLEKQVGDIPENDGPELDAYCAALAEIDSKVGYGAALARVQRAEEALLVVGHNLLIRHTVDAKQRDMVEHLYRNRRQYLLRRNMINILVKWNGAN